MAQRDDGCLKGILIGCGGLLVLVFVLGALGWYKVVRPVQEGVGRLDSISTASEELAAGLEALDARFAYEAPADLADVELGEEDVERYVAVRRALEQPLADLLRVDAAEGEADPDAGMVSRMREMFGTMFGTVEEYARERVALQRAALEALESREMSRREFRDLMELIEWRFLRRGEAAFFGLPPGERELLLDQTRELREARQMLVMSERFGIEVNGQQADDLRSRIGRLETQVAVMRDRAWEGAAEKGGTTAPSSP